MKHDLTLVALNQEQITKAKEVNGTRKQITHAVICGPYGQLFGTEKQCLKYFSVWDPAYRIEVTSGKHVAIFPNLFSKAVKTDRYEISNFEHTFNLVNKLIALNDARQG